MLPNSVVHDLLVIYAVGLGLGMIVGFVKWGIFDELTFFEAMAPAVIWPLAILKECWKFLRK